MATNIIVKRYKSDSVYQRDAQKMRDQGYTVQSVTSEQPRSGCMRIILTGGLGALFWKPKPQLVVTYIRA
ncbi:MAG: hypothetical protein QM346_17880 [Chloroflexota bacterium]|nr:hypothetical protein [Chloroflexota bacterium]